MTVSEITFVQNFDSENGDTALVELFRDGDPLVTFTYARSTGRVSAEALSPGVTLDFDNYRAVIRAIELMIAHADASFGPATFPAPSPQQKGSDERNGALPKPVSRTRWIGGAKLVDVEWEPGGEAGIVTVKPRAAIDLDRSGFRIWLVGDERVVRRCQDQIAGR